MMISDLRFEISDLNGAGFRSSCRRDAVRASCCVRRIRHHAERVRQAGPVLEKPALLGERGFTLMEILVAISILAVIVTLVYESFAAVTDATAAARTSAEQLRLRQFLARNLSQNLSTVYVDPAYSNEQLQFVGMSGKGVSGSSDWVEFCSSAPLIGGMAPPGFFKRVHYGISENSGADRGLGSLNSEGADDLSGSTATFEASESLVAISSPSGNDTNSMKAQASQIAEVVFGEGLSPTWSVPVSEVQISYFDGQQWQPEWDSMDLGRMPWCVRIRINFAKTKAEEGAGFGRTSIDEDPDFEMYVPIPMGSGVLTDASMWQQSLGVGVASGTTTTTGTGATTTSGKGTTGDGGRPSSGGTGASTTGASTTGTSTTTGGGSS